ncbi:MAG: hypothetical protein QM675_09815 [Protaetiibacter sp.]
MSTTRVVAAAAVLVVAATLAGCGRSVLLTNEPASSTVPSAAPTSVELDALLDQADAALRDAETLLEEADESASEETRP